MNKDFDERLVPNGEYRHAMNVQVSTSEGSDVGIIENLLGNHLLPGNFRIPNGMKCIGSIADEKDDSLYWFIGSVREYTPDYTMLAVPSVASTAALRLAEEAPRGPDPGGPSGTALYPNDYFTPIHSGGAIIKYNEGTGIEAVVWEAKQTICSLNFLQSEPGVYTNTNPPVFLQGFHNIFLSPVSFSSLLPGMELVKVEFLDPNYTPGQPVSVVSSHDLSLNPPVISYQDQFTSSIQLDFLPDILEYNWNPGDVVALHFVNNISSPLNFNTDSMITGINIIDDMLFWTDNYNEPKKINIPRCIEGTPPVTGYVAPGSFGWYNPTRLICKDRGIDWDNGIILAEHHVTMIKQPPTTAPSLELKTGRDYTLANPTAGALPKVYTAAITITEDQPSQTDSITHGYGNDTYYPYDFSSVSIGDRLRLQIVEDIYSHEEFTLLWPEEGAVLVLKEFNDDGTPPATPITNYRIKVKVVDASSGFRDVIAGAPARIIVEVITINGFPPQAIPTSSGGTGELKYAVDLFEQEEKIFEFKFPRFATRYKYEDGEYSAFSPWTEVAFAPGSFDYHPKKGYNLGMTNRLREVLVKNFRLNDTPLDVVAIDILYKEDQSPNVYVVDTIKPGDESVNYWDLDAYPITNETIKAIIPSNQLLRPYDNVPRKALAQEVVGNRIIYGNYLQGFDLFTANDKPYRPNFQHDILENSTHKLAWNTNVQSVQKSIKSLREYQLGVVFVDNYGRETPVISNKSGTFKLDKRQSSTSNRIRVSFDGIPPENMKYYKFYIKETSGEYYNLAMDRWYDAEDGNIWIGFPSSDRNKVDEDTFIILKKAAGSNVAVSQDARFKIIAIENEAPDFIKQKRKLVVDKKHVLNTTSAGTGGDDVFGGSSTVIPRENFDEFSVNYAPFWATSANKLHETEDDLYISFTQGSSASSERYRVASLSHESDVAQTGGVWHFKLEKPMGSDINFITDDPLNGTNATKVEDGTQLKIWKYKVENSPEFDGRFFVKIFKDEVAREHIQGNALTNLDYRTIASKKIYLLRPYDPFHQKTHSVDATGHGEFGSNANNKSAYTGQFGRYACYFRKYNYGNSDPFQGSATYDKATSKYRFKSPSRYNYDDDVYTSPTEHDSWLDEWNMYTGDQIASTTVANEYLNPNGTKGTDGDIGIDARADVRNKDHEVWFIDAGRYNHSHPSYPALGWLNVPYGDTNNTNPASSNGLAGGSMKYASSRWYHMNLSFGPVVPQHYVGRIDIPADGKDYVSDVFNIGDGNPIYENDRDIITWTDQISASSSWRWKEDPNGIIYNIRTGGASFTRKLRYWGGKSDGEEGSGRQEWINSSGNGKRTRAAQLSTNINSSFRFINEHEEQINWIPVSVENTDRQPTVGPIEGGGTTTLTTDATLAQDSDSAGEIENYHIIVTKDSFEKSIKGTYPDFPDANSDAITTDETRWAVQPGMILYAYGDDVAGTSGALLTGEENNPTGNPTSGNFSFINPYLVVRNIEFDDSNNTYKIYLTGYFEALDIKHVPGADALTGAHADAPVAVAVSKNVYFAQATMNGYSPNSASRISLQKSTTGKGAFTNSSLVGTPVPSENLLYAVGYTMEFVEEYTDAQELPENPAVWETEPKETPELDIYYEASGLIPFKINSETMSTLIPLQRESVWPFIGTMGAGINIGSYENCIIETSEYTTGFTIPIGTTIIAIAGNTLTLSNSLDYQSPQYDTDGVLLSGDPNQSPYLGWGPAYSGQVNNFLPDMIAWQQQGNSGDKIVYITRPDGSSFSAEVIDILQDRSGQFAHVKIGPDTYNYWHTLNWHNCYSFLNGVESNRIRDSFNLPFISNGVQASTTLDSDQYVEEHRKNGLIYSGLYNETSKINNLNQFIQAEKITKDINPEYGSIQKLHTRDSDLITLCEDKVLKILANKDAVFNADGNPQLTANQNVLGQTIPFVGEYGISKNPESFASEAYRAYFTDKVRGTVMRLSKDGLTPISDHGMRDWFKDHLRLSDQLIGSYDDRQREYNISIRDASYLVSFNEDVRGWPSFKSFTDIESGVSMANNYYTFYHGKIYQHHHPAPLYNEFYGFTTSSTITTLINSDPGTVKNFKTLAYEGSKGRITPPRDGQGNFINDGQYYNLQTDTGWYLSSIITDLDEGSLVEFIEKEGKWFNYIKGLCSNIDDTEFSYQGIGVITTSLITNVDGTSLTTMPQGGGTIVANRPLDPTVVINPNLPEVITTSLPDNQTNTLGTGQTNTSGTGQTNTSGTGNINPGLTEENINY